MWWQIYVTLFIAIHSFYSLNTTKKYQSDFTESKQNSHYWLIYYHDVLPKFTTVLPRRFNTCTRELKRSTQGSSTEIPNRLYTCTGKLKIHVTYANVDKYCSDQSLEMYTGYREIIEIESHNEILDTILTFNCVLSQMIS